MLKKIYNYNIWFIFISLLINPSFQQNSNQNNVVFDLADLTVDYDSNEGTIHLEAFKSTFNDLIIKNKEVENYGQLNWVSIGFPKLILNQISPNKSSLITFKTEGFDLTVEMLTNSQRNLFKDIVKRKYNIDIRSDQIVSLIPAKFECQITFYQDDTKILINGKVEQLTRFPLKLSFVAPSKSKERIFFEKKLLENNNELNVGINCEINSLGTVARRNTLIITSSQFNQLGLMDKIFGPGSEVYVSRDQISTITSELYQKLNVIEEYQMPQTQFNENFVDDFIKQTAQSTFQYVGIDQVLAQFSKYDFTQDIMPSVIKNELSRLMTIKKVSNKELLQFNQTHYEKLDNQYGKNTGGSFFGINFGGSASYSKTQQSIWEKSGTSFQNQLNELNTFDKNEVEWSRNGNIIIPKSIKVSKLSKALFNKNLVFSRVKLEYYDAPFKRSFTLDTNNQLFPSQILIQVWDKLTNLEAKFEQTNQKINVINNGTQTTMDKLTNQANQIKSLIDQTNKFYIPKVLTNIIEGHFWPQCSSQGSILINAADKYWRYSKTVYFESRFNKPPKILLSIYTIDNDVRYGLRINYFAEQITEDKFQINFETWWDTCVYIFRIYWIAIGN